MVTYKGLPAPHICDFWDRQSSAANYDDGSTFQIGRIDMVANTGTYLDTPFHRYADGDDLAAVSLERLAGLEGLCVRAEGMEAGAELFEGLDVAGKAVLVNTGWDRHWRTDAYSSGHPFLAEAAARLLAGRGAALVGDRQLKYRRHAHPPPPGPHDPARRGHPDLRAYDRPRRASAERLPLHRRSAEGGRNGNLSGQGLRGDRLRRFTRPGAPRRASPGSGPRRDRRAADARRPGRAPDNGPGRAAPARRPERRPAAG